VYLDISLQYEPTGCTIYLEGSGLPTASQHKSMTYTNCCIYVKLNDGKHSLSRKKGHNALWH